MELWDDISTEKMDALHRFGESAENCLGRGRENYLTNYFTVRFWQITGSDSWPFTKKCVLLQAIRGKKASPPAPLPGEGGPDAKETANGSPLLGATRVSV